MAIINFQVNEEIQAENDFSPIPAGRYKVIIEDVAIGDTKAGTGKYLKIQLRVAEGQQYANRMIWTYINYQNVNSTAERIGQQKLNQLLISCGLRAIRDTDELLNRAVDAQIIVREGSNGYEASNDVKSFHKVEVNVPSGAYNAPSATKPQTNNNLPPWHTTEEDYEERREATVPF